MICGRSSRIRIQINHSSESLADSNTLLLKHRQKTTRKITICSLVSLLLCLFAAFSIIWILVPISFMLSLPFQTFMVFIPIDSPRNFNFDQPDTVGLAGVHNFYLKTRDYYDNGTFANIGIWLLLPESEINMTTTTNIEEILQNTQYDVLVYLHGVLANRAKAVEQYKVLRKHFLILGIDHRGYGDSGLDVRQSEEGIANDNLQIYSWLRTTIPQKDIYFWGHSLGSALSAKSLKTIKEQSGLVPKGLVLESPFTTLQDVLENIILGKIFSWLAYFHSTITEPLDKNGFHFRTKDNILSVDCPVMILHAEDDGIVPFALGEKLAKVAEENRQQGQGEVIFHSFDRWYGYGHNDILMHPGIGDYIEEFRKVCRNFTGH